MLHRTIKQLHGDLTSGKLSAKEVWKICNERAKETENLNAFVRLNPYSSKEAEVSDEHLSKGTPRSVLEGIPVAVKDNFCMKDVETTCGSKMLQHFKPKYTATVVEKLLSGGSMVVGKTNLDEFAMGSGTVDSIHGATRNCWGAQGNQDWHIAGGSSGGSAVAVASGICLGALGSDTGGSTRNPAAYCGVVGLKPSYGLLSRHGLIPLVNSMDVPGILALHVEDACTLLGANLKCLADGRWAMVLNCSPLADHLTGHDARDSTTLRGPRQPTTLPHGPHGPSLKGLTIGVPVEYNTEGLSGEVKEVWQAVARLLEQGGASVQEVSMPHTRHSIVCYSVLNQCEVASNMARYDGLQFGRRSANTESAAQMAAHTRAEGFNHVVRSRILAGNYFLLQDNYDKYFVKALKVRRLIAEDFGAVWRGGCHALLTPTMLTEAPKYSDFMRQDHREQCAAQDFCTQPANMAGCPAVSIPIQLSKNGLPLSLQLMAPSMEERTMMTAARYIEQAVQFHQHRIGNT